MSYRLKKGVKECTAINLEIGVITTHIRGMSAMTKKHENKKINNRDQDFYYGKSM